MHSVDHPSLPIPPCPDPSLPPPDLSTPSGAESDGARVRERAADRAVIGRTRAEQGGKQQLTLQHIRCRLEGRRLVCSTATLRAD